MLAKNIENKRIGNTIEYSVQHNSPIGSADCKAIVPAIPPIGAGGGVTSNSQRIGDRVKPKALVVKGVVSLQLATPVQRDVYVRVIIAAQKSIKVGAQVNAGNVDTDHLLRPSYPGAGLDQAPFSGYTMDLEYQVNKDLFHVYMDKIIKLHACAEGGVESLGRYSARWSYKFKKLPSTFTFDEGTGDWPNNFAPFHAIGYAYSDGTAPDTVATPLVNNTYSYLEFEDA